MDIDIINGWIEELEHSETTLSNIRNLSALYNVRSHILGANKDTKNNVEKELRDIFPSYIHYIDTKRSYQLKNTTKNAVQDALKELCKEIYDFIKTLYTATDFEEERTIINEAFQKILL